MRSKIERANRLGRRTKLQNEDLIDELKDQQTWYNKSRDFTKNKDIYKNKSDLGNKSDAYQSGNNSNKKNIRLIKAELNKYKSKISHTSKVSIHDSRSRIE